MALSDCKLIDIPKIHDPRGNLSFIEEFHHVPFEIKRVYYLYDVPPDAIRAGHAHKNLHQVLIPLSGSFDVILDDGFSKKELKLCKPFQGLYIFPLTWRELKNFSVGAVCISIVSDYYDESDYFRDYSAYLDFVRGLV